MELMLLHWHRLLLCEIGLLLYMVQMLLFTAAYGQSIDLVTHAPSNKKTAAKNDLGSETLAAISGAIAKSECGCS